MMARLEKNFNENNKIKVLKLNATRSTNFTEGVKINIENKDIEFKKEDE